MRKVSVISAVVVGLALSGGCMHAKAKAPGPIAVLVVPEPPSRMLVPVDLEPPPVPPAPPVNPSTTTPATPARTPASGRGTPPPTTQPPTTPVENPPSPVVQTAGSLPELEWRAKERLDNAKKILGRVQKASLGRDAQDQYASAARFIRQAEDAMTAKNFLYAISCSDKAATLASLLVK